MGLTYDELDGYRYLAAQYELLEQPWLSYGRIARHYARQADIEDREDLAQDIVLKLAQAARKHDGLSPWLMLTIAKYAWVNYLRDKHKLSRFCSLNRPLRRDDPNGTEMWEVLPDDKALDLDAWADARLELARYPARVQQAAAKRVAGELLSNTEWSLLCNCRKRGGPPRPFAYGELQRFAHIIRERASRDGWGSTLIWREIRGLGYQGSLGAVKRLMGGEKTRAYQREYERRQREQKRSLSLTPA